MPTDNDIYWVEALYIIALYIISLSRRNKFQNDQNAWGDPVIFFTFDFYAIK